MSSSHPVLVADDVAVHRDGVVLLDGVSLAVAAGEHWALLGPNGSGKSTLLTLLGAHRHPTRGAVSVLGRQLGRVDLRDLRALLGHVDPRHVVREPLTAHEVVLTGVTGTPLPLIDWRPSPDDESRALELEDLLGITPYRDRAWAVLSAGERGRTLIARALMPSPRLLLLDEPATGLDVVARWGLGDALERLAAAHPTLATVTATHHLEDLPSTTTHALLLGAGRVVAAGPVVDVLTDTAMSAAYGAPVAVRRDAHGGWRLVRG